MREHKMNFDSMTLDELVQLQVAVVREVNRRRELAQIPEQIAQALTAYQAAKGVTEGEPWVQPVTVGYPKDWPVTHNGQTWTSTVANNVWEPGVSAWHPEAGEGEDAPAWQQPTGAHDAYAKDAVVTHNGKTWTSDLDGNVWEPGEYGWTET